MRVRVYLATTAGPVRVERLTRERAQQSAVCLGRTTKVLAVSTDYDAFVRQPSGVVEREFGPMEPGAFRLDVDGPIDDGDSWQLGVFAAHMLARDHALAGPGEPEDRAIWLTGAVHNDLAVAPVDHIPEKLKASRDLFATLAKGGVPLTLVLPPGGCDHAEAADLPADIEIIEVASTKELAAATGMDRSTLTAGPRPEITESGARRLVRPGLWLLLAATVLTLVGGVTALSIVRERDHMGQIAFEEGLPALAQELKRADRDGWIRGFAADLVRQTLRADLPDEGDIRLEILERRAPEGRTCAAVHFGNVEPILIPVEPAPEGSLAPSDRNGLCGLAFSITTNPARLHAAALFRVSLGKFIYGETTLDVQSGSLVFSETPRWTIDLPRWPDGPFAYRIDLVASRRPVSVDIIGMNGVATAEDFADLGILYRPVEHRVER